MEEARLMYNSCPKCGQPVRRYGRKTGDRVLWFIECPASCYGSQGFTKEQAEARWKTTWHRAWREVFPENPHDTAPF